MTRRLLARLFGCALLALGVRAPLANAEAINQVAGELITFNTNGAWSWYMDERVVVDTVAGKLLMSSVAESNGTNGAARNGNIDFVSYDLATGQTSQFVLHAALGGDDHDAAGIMIRPDGRYLAVYTRHNADKTTYYRVSSNPHDATSWMPEQSFNWAATPNSDFNVTYSNLFYLSAEDRTYNFARANNRSPNMMISGNGGTTWTYGGKLVYNPVNVGYVNGYFKYASNGVDRIDFIATEHHPRDFNNSIYHGYIQGGQMFRSDGTLVDADIFDNVAPNQTSLTQIFASDPEDGNQVYSRAWTTDLQIDGNGNPYGVFTARYEDVPVNTNGYNDHRFFYARYDGSQWNVHELAKAGARLYPSEQDYTGLVALDPSNPDVLYMSTTIDPRDDADLGVHEIFKGVTGDGGGNWTWTPITFNSTVDNLRPIVPIWDDEHTALVWMQGTYYSQVNYDMKIVGLTEFGPLVGQLLGDLNLDGVVDPLDIGQFFTYMHTDLTGLTEAEAQAKGDLNGDFKNDYADFVLFQKAYEDENGPGSFAAVPEPSSLVLLGLSAAGCGLGLIRRARTMRLGNRRRTWKL
jgi:BNR repeat-containing family member/PEP-CTERM motif